MSHNYALTCPVGKDYHITIAYFSNIIDAEHKQIDDLWRARVTSRVTPVVVRNVSYYYSEFGVDFQLAAPKSVGAKSVLVVGRLATLIFRFREQLKNEFSALFAKISLRFPDPHIEVGVNNAQNWSNLILEDVKLL